MNRCISTTRKTGTHPQDDKGWNRLDLKRLGDVALGFGFHVKHQQLRILLGEFQHDFVHLSTWSRPRCPEIDEGHSVEVRRQERLKMLWRGDLIVVRGQRGHDFEVFIQVRVRNRKRS